MVQKKTEDLNLMPKKLVLYKNNARKISAKSSQLLALNLMLKEDHFSTNFLSIIFLCNLLFSALNSNDFF